MTWEPYLEPIISIEEWIAKFTPAEQITELEAAIDWAKRGITDQDIPHLERLLAEARKEHTNNGGTQSKGA